ncbi:N-acetylmuramoyl-L-alanine amidase family protein [Deferrisoma palaeochoriense]
MDRLRSLAPILLVLLCLAGPRTPARGEDSTSGAGVQRPGPRLVLDPGHGGAEGGARAEAGPEDAAALELAKALATRLEALGLVVFLTREADQDLPEPLRAAFANYREADLYLSVHFSGEPRTHARGFEVFVPPPPPAGVDPQLWEAGQAGVWERSRRWAEALRRRLGEAAPSFDRGIGTLPHPALEAVTCPAALVEFGSLAWPEDTAWWRRPEGAEALARAVARAVEDVLGPGEPGSETPTTE